MPTRQTSLLSVDSLAAAFLAAGPWTPQALRSRARQALGGRRSPRWLARLVGRMLKAFPTPPNAEAGVLAWLCRDEKLLAVRSAVFDDDDGQALNRLYWLTPQMRPSPWPVPPLNTTAALAEWLGLDSPAQLDWFADRRCLEAHTPEGPLRHYDYHWLVGKKRRQRRRLIERPRPRLKALQRRILHGLLDHIPAHEAAHGYRPGRSIVSNALPHVGQRLVLRLDLRQFFPSVSLARVRALFRTAGYPEEVACALAGLCTNVTPPDVWPEGADAADRGRYRSPHLPQGAPTSPALANLCAYRLDCRLAGLARRVGAGYTRYADDLSFSGGEAFARQARRLHIAVCRITLEEGFEVNTRKTRFMRRGSRQQLAGVVVNERVNVRRETFDQLKAILTNCLRHGPASQNRAGVADFRSHLAGRIAHLARLNPRRGERLRALFERLDWRWGTQTR